jgi:hypothetical protein
MDFEGTRIVGAAPDDHLADCKAPGATRGSEKPPLGCNVSIGKYIGIEQVLAK